VASTVPVAEGAKIGIDLQRGDASWVDGFFAFTTRGEELLNSDEESAEIL